jgi:hypothetical protein
MDGEFGRIDVLGREGTVIPMSFIWIIYIELHNESEGVTDASPRT